jgi:putative ABC transport system permease protein
MLLSDFHVALRSLRRRPGFVAVAVATLALGIGANTAIFGIVNAVLLEPLPFAQPDRLVVLAEENAREGRRDDVSAPNYTDWKSQSESFSSLSAWIPWGLALTGRGEPRDLDAVRASSDLFATLGVVPALGRAFLPEEEVPGRDQVAVLSDGFWRESFGADPAVLGRTLALDGKVVTVIGVMPAGFRFPDDQAVAVWVPLALSPHEATYRSQRMFHVIARLKPGTSIDRAESDLKGIASRLAEQYPETNNAWTVRVDAARTVYIGSQRPLIILLSAVTLVLLIACVNLVNLMLARGADRRKEIAVRVALGADRGNIVRHLLLESLILGVLGGVVGLALALGGIRLFIALDPGTIPRWNAVTLDVRVLLFVALLAMGSALVAALLPARQALRTEVSASLKDGGTSSGGRGHNRLRQGLVIAEVALAFVLVTGAGLLIHSLYRLQRVDPGFRPDRLVVTTVSLATTRYPEDAEQHAFFDRLRSRLESSPDVQSVALVTTLPMSPLGIDHDMAYVVADEPPPGSGREPQADFRIATAGYFEVMGIPVRKGREFSEQDRADAPRVMVVNETMAKLAFPDGRVLGRKVTTGGFEFEVIGVVADVRHRELATAPRPEMFVHEPQIYSYGHMTVAVRTRGDPQRAAAAIKREVHSLDPDQPVGPVTSMPELISDSVSRRRFNLVILTVFAGVGLALAAIGIYGIISYSVGQRTREIGIRAALGAGHASLLGLVLGSGLRLALAGVGLGMMGAAGLTQLLQSQLFELSPLDPVSFLATGLVVAVVALLASWLPALRALKVDPMRALKAE